MLPAFGVKSNSRTVESAVGSARRVERVEISVARRAER